MRLPTFEDVRAAAVRIEGVTVKTPLLRSGGMPAALRRLQTARRLQQDRKFERGRARQWRAGLFLRQSRRRRGGRGADVRDSRIDRNAGGRAAGED